MGPYTYIDPPEMQDLDGHGGARRVKRAEIGSRCSIDVVFQVAVHE
jgi:hypothetical protein